MLKNLTGFIILIIAIVALNACEQPNSSSSSSNIESLQSEADSISYSIGLDIGKNLKQGNLDSISLNALFTGISDGYWEKEGLMNKQDADNYIRTYFQARQQKIAQENQKKADENLKKAEEFLAENKDKEGVITTESGLQYEIIKEGNGPVPEKTDRVSVYYTGKRLDGTVFDETEEGSPATFNVGGVIKGWTEALLMMPVGSKWKLYVPPSLGYGQQARGDIQPNDLLIFEVELVDIENK